MNLQRIKLVATLALLAAAGWIVIEHDALVPPRAGSAPSLPASDKPIPTPEKRNRARLLVLRDERGRIPHDGLMRAKAQIASLLTGGIAGGLDSTRWTEAGPGNVGGRIRAIAIHPTSPSTIFIGSVSGGIWKSVNAGATWARIDDKMGNLAITSIVLQPGNPSVLYAGTGEGFNNGHAIQGAGIFKSTDGGTTWARLANTSTPDFYWVNRLSISPDGNTLLAATGSGIWRSTDGGQNWARTDGTSPNAGSLDVRFSPSRSNVAVAHYTDFVLTSWESRALYSTDGGATWQVSTGLTTFDTSRTELAWHRGWTGAGDGCVYAQKDLNGTTLFRSTDGGKTYTQVSTSQILGGQGWYDNCLWIDPSDRDANTSNDRVVAGGIDLWRSTNGGASFTQISQWELSPVSAHADHHAIIEHPGFDGNTNKTVYFGNDGGIYRAADVYTVQGILGWTALNNSLGITQFYGGSRHAGADIVYGGTQDNGTLRTDTASGYNGWVAPFGGDGGFSASDPTDSNYHYGEYVNAQVHRSSDGGLLAEYIWGDGKNPPYAITEAGSNALFIAPFILDPNQANRMLVGCASLWRTNDVKTPNTLTTGPSWAAIKAPLTGGENISAIAVATGDSAVVWVGHENGDVYYTTNGTAANPNWVQRDNTAPALPDRYVARLVVDPADKSHVFALFGGYSTDNIWETKNSGANWTAFTNFPQVPVRDLEIHPTKAQWLYAATEAGLLVSEDSGQSWTAAASHTDVSFDELFWSGDRLYAVTHGRGIFWQAPTVGGQASATPVGTACKLGGPAGGPNLAATPPVLGRNMTFTVSNAAFPSAGVLFLGLVPAAPIPIPPSCFFYIDIVNGPMFLMGTTPIGNGTGTFGLAVPNDNALMGARVASQAVVATTEIWLTNGVNLVLGN